MVTAQADHRDGLDFEQRIRVGQMRYGDGRAGGKILAEDFSAQFREAAMVARIGDEHRHGHHVGELSAGFRQGGGERREHGANLRVEIAGERLAGGIDRPGMPGEPDGSAALRHHGLRIARAFRGVALDETLARGLGGGRSGADRRQAAEERKLAKDFTPCRERHGFPLYFFVVAAVAGPSQPMIRSATWMLFLSIISIWLLPLMPSAGRYRNLAVPPAALMASAD